MKINLNQEKEICLLYENGENGHLIAKKFNINPVTVYRIIRKHGFLVKSMSQAKTIYQIDENLFNKIDCEWKAYFLGLLFADGNVHKNNIKLALQFKDKLILEKLNKIVFNGDKNLTHCKGQKIVTKLGKEYWGKDKFLLEISNKKISEAIRDLGCVSNKSLILKFPNEEQVPKEFLNHFIRGYFDGDGTIFNRKNTKQLGFKILGSKYFIPKLKEYFINNLELELKIRERGNILSLETYDREKIQIIYQFMYKDSNLFLERKRNKFL